ncbi:response regulator transcription factor [Atopobacter phocae]|uniref:response regulator transcription factor n=1 Tax=Atopobacter phocae TaxID=136492 RepID=UPI00046E7EC9|nr:response regulator transcription factor [Atopobacter phocae]
MRTILLVDDEEAITDVIRRYLKREGYEVLIAKNGKEALKLYKQHLIDLIITDIMMPEMDGYEFIDEVLQIKERAPFIFVTAKNQEQDKLYSLMIGADDFITKPFSPRELTLRVKNILRRIHPENEKVQGLIEVGPFALDELRHQVSLYNSMLNLSIKEFHLLKLFLTNLGRVFSKSELYELVWETEYFESANTLNVHIHELRNKLEVAANGQAYPQIKTVWGLGYRMEQEECD